MQMTKQVCDHLVKLLVRNVLAIGDMSSIQPVHRQFDPYFGGMNLLRAQNKRKSGYALAALLRNYDASLRAQKLFAQQWCAILHCAGETTA